MTDETKARRRTQANAIRVLASPARLPMEEFKRHYQKRHVIIDEKAREAMEQATQEMFCDECTEPMPHGGMSAHILHVSINDDPLGNFWKLATMRCYGCGLEEHVALDKPVFDPKDFNEIGMVPMAPRIGTPIAGQAVDPRNPWKEEYRAQHEVFARNQAIAQPNQALSNQKMAWQALQGYGYEEMIDREERAKKSPPPKPEDPDKNLIQYIKSRLGR
jgi:RNase P subunit RPR2